MQVVTIHVGGHSCSDIIVFLLNFATDATHPFLFSSQRLTDVQAGSSTSKPKA